MVERWLAETWRTLWSRRLRSLLTMLGMVIGVSSVILLTAIGEGARATIKEMIVAMGSNLLIVTSGSVTGSGGVRSGTGEKHTLTYADAIALEELAEIRAISPVISGVAQVVGGDSNWSTTVLGVSPSYFALRNWQLAAGELFGEQDLRAAARVAVIGESAATQLFGLQDPVGKIIRVQHSPYTVVGVLAAKGQSLGGKDSDDAIWIPITTAQRQLLNRKFPHGVRWIFVQATAPTELAKVSANITELLRQRHHLASEIADDFVVKDLTELAQVALSTTRLLTTLLGAVAAISLLVGGVGIMNIMLVSVTERTREIGIRMALGARRREILGQFLLEALVISILGCTLGIVIGIWEAWMVGAWLNLRVVISLSTVMMAWLIAAGIGVGFGYYPARRAAQLRPIDALRQPSW